VPELALDEAGGIDADETTEVQSAGHHAFL
jgi:hypothetical protein